MVNALNLAATTLTTTSTANTTQYWWVAANTGLWLSTTETQAQILHRSAGTFSNLSIRITANTVNATTVFTLRKNAAAGSQTISVTTGTPTGAFSDTTHSDTIAAADKTAVESKPGTGSTGTFNSIAMSMAFAATTDTVTRSTIVDTQSIAVASTTYFNHLSGFTPAASGLNTTESNVKCRQRKAGTFKNACINVTTNARTASTYTFRKNGANGTVTATITASTPGFYEDTTHSDTVAVADDVNHQMVTGTGTASIVIQSWVIDFVSTASFGQVVASARTGQATTDGTSAFLEIAGEGSGTLGTETEVTSMNAYTYQELTIHITANDVTSASTCVLRNQSADSALTVPITASTANVFSDSTHTVTVASTDTQAIGVTVPAVAGTHSVTYWQISMWTTASGGGPANISRTAADTVVYGTETLARLAAKQRRAASMYTTM